MSEWSESKLPGMEDLSALVDGELEASAAERACGRWRDDADLRDSWHAYHLIGDVLRSDDLASTRQRDTAFLAALQQRLAQEPVVLAPAPLEKPLEPRAPRRAWTGPAAVAAGFVAVAGVLVVTQMSGALPFKLGQPGSQIAQGASAPQEIVQARDTVVYPQGVDLGADAQAVVLNGRLIRDVRLDEYLAAHKKFGGSSAPGVPSGFLRNAAVDGTAR